MHLPLSNPCPFCAKQVPAATARCPHCRETIAVALGATGDGRGLAAPPVLAGPRAPHAGSKSVAVAVLLTFFFGPLGMAYSTVAGCLTMLFLNLAVVLLAGRPALCLTFPICLLWAAAAASNHNSRRDSQR
jgi:hypothetical protein